MSGTKRTCGGYRGRGEEEEGEKKKNLQEEDCGRMEWNGEFVAARRTSLDTRHLTAGGPRTRLPGHLQSPSRRLGGVEGEKDDDGHIISHHGHHLSPPVVPIHARGSYSMLLHTYIEKKK